MNEHAGVAMERAAAALHDVDRRARPAQQVRGRLGYPGEVGAGPAAVQQRELGRGVRSDRCRGLGHRWDRVGGAFASRQPSAEPLGHPDLRSDSQPSLMRRQRQHDPLRQWRSQPLSGKFEERPILDSARTGGLASSAPEAAIEAWPYLAPWDRAIVRRADKVDPASRRVGLRPGQSKRWAAFEAEAAANARRREIGDRSFAQNAPSAPGLNLPSGSSNSLARRK